MECRHLSFVLESQRSDDEGWHGTCALGLLEVSGNGGNGGTQETSSLLQFN
jgi:hypothetical protein